MLSKYWNLVFVRLFAKRGEKKIKNGSPPVYIKFYKELFHGNNSIDIHLLIIKIKTNVKIRIKNNYLMKS